MAKKLKIIFFTQTLFGVRGTSGISRLIEITSQRHDVIVISPDKPGDEQYVVYENAEIRSIKMTRITSIRSLLEIKEIFRKFRPHLAYMFNSNFNLYFPFYLSPLFPRVKWVLDIRTPLLQEGANRKIARNRSFFLQFYVDMIITLSRHSVKTWIPFLLRKTIEIPLGIDSRVFIPKQVDGQRIRCNNFVFIGSLHPFRKLEFLVIGFGKLIKKYPDIPFTLDIYGSGPAIGALQDLIENEDTGDRISLCGQLNQAELFKRLIHYDAGIAYVPYEKYNKSPSLKALEYAAAGLPVLASDTIGHRNQMINGITFSLFSNDDNSFTKCIINAATQGIETEQLRNNLDKVRFFDNEYIVSKYVLPRVRELVSRK